MTAFKRITVLFAALALVLSVFCFPVTSQASGERVVITLDAGHGGPSDPGACHGSVAEKELNLEMAYKIKALLEANGGFTVYLTRTGDTALTKAQRLKIANDYNSDFLLSIHFDGSNDRSANGVTVYTSVLPEYSPNALASSIASNLASVGFRNNGLKQRGDPDCFWNSNKQWDVYDSSVGINADYYGIISWGCKFGFPAIIVEHGYMSNEGDINHILSEGTLDRMAEAEANALISYFAGHSHTYGAQVVDYPSNCAIQGKSSSHCTVCRHRKNVTVLEAAPDNHYYYSDAIVSHKVSCDTEESVTYKCRISENFIEKELYCEDHTLTNVLKPKTEHNYVVTYSQEVTHTTDGITRYSCTNCSSNYTETVKAEGHSWEYKDTTAATCSENGAVTYVCTVCSEEYADVISAFGHSYVRTELLSEPTCIEAGNEAVVCETCGYETELEIAPLGHLREVLEHVDSSCEVQGYDKCFCERCSEEYTEYLEKPEHDYVLTEETELTCTTDKTSVYECTICADVKTEVYEKAAHKYEETERTQPTCENTGVLVRVCCVCSDTVTESFEATGHLWETTESIQEKSFFKDGILRYICSNDPTHTYDEYTASAWTLYVNNPLYVMGTLAVIFVVLPALFLVIFFMVLKAKKKGGKTEEAEETKKEDSETEESPEEKAEAEEKTEEPAEIA